MTLLLIVELLHNCQIYLKLSKFILNFVKFKPMNTPTIHSSQGTVLGFGGQILILQVQRKI